MIGGHQKVLNEILLNGLHSLDPLAAPVLALEVVLWARANGLTPIRKENWLTLYYSYVLQTGNVFPRFTGGLANGN